MEKQQSNDEEVASRERCAKEARDLSKSAPSPRVSDTLIPHLLNLYGSCASPADFEIYAPNASFEDPLMSAHGVKQIKSSFYSLSKVFSESKIVEYSVEEKELAPGKQEVLIDNKQHYKFMGKNIEMISLIKLTVEEEKIVRHEDWWDKKPLWNRDTASFSIVGRFMECARRGSMLATHALMKFVLAFGALLSIASATNEW